MAVPPTDMGGMANGAVESSAESPQAQASPELRKKGRGLRRWRRIERDHRKEESPSVGAAGGDTAGDDAAQLHKRRLPLGATVPPKGKHEASAEGESSTASVESRFIPLELAPAKLDPDLGLLVASVGFSVGAGGADSDNSEDRSSKSSTAASAPRHHFARERDRPRAHAAASLHGKNHRTARARADRPRTHAAFSPTEVENSRSASVESDGQSSNTVNGRKPGVGIVGNGIHKVRSDDDDHSEEEQLSEEVRSTAEGCCTRNGSSVVGRLVQGSGDSGDADAEDTLDEGSVGKSENGLRMNSGADAYAESILLLQRTQESLENEIQEFVVIGKESADDFDIHDDEGSESLYLDEHFEEASEKGDDLESRMEQASALIKEKDSRILELEALSRTRAWRSAIQTTNNLLLQLDLDQLLQEKMEAEIQCIILTRAVQTWTPLPEDGRVLYEEQTRLLSNYKQLELKLRQSENRATIIGELVNKLEVQAKELSACSEILQLQSRATTLSLFCFIQFILLLIAIGIFLVRLLPFSSEFVPT